MTRGEQKESKMISGSRTCFIQARVELNATNGRRIVTLTDGKTGRPLPDPGRAREIPLSSRTNRTEIRSQKKAARNGELEYRTVRQTNEAQP